MSKLTKRITAFSLAVVIVFATMGLTLEGILESPMFIVLWIGAAFPGFILGPRAVLLQTIALIIGFSILWVVPNWWLGPTVLALLMAPVIAIGGLANFFRFCMEDL